MRREANNFFEEFLNEQFLNSMNDSVFGEALENLRVDVKFKTV